jgi:hypothetical protein
MKKIIICSTLVLFLSCDSNVRFVSPQPENMQALQRVPAKYHGEYVWEDQSKDTFIVNANSIIPFGFLSDSLIIKQRGNYLYVNLLQDGAYVLSVVRINQILSYQKIVELSNLEIAEDKKHLFNIVEVGAEFFGKPNYLIKQVSVNQLNLLVNSSQQRQLMKLK